MMEIFLRLFMLLTLFRCIMKRCFYCVWLFNFRSFSNMRNIFFPDADNRECTLPTCFILQTFDKYFFRYFPQHFLTQTIHESKNLIVIDLFPLFFAPSSLYIYWETFSELALKIVSCTEQVWEEKKFNFHFLTNQIKYRGDECRYIHEHS